MMDDVKKDDVLPAKNELPESEFEHLQTGPNLFVETIRLMIIALAIVLPIRIFIVAPFIVEGASMEPNYHNAEYLLVDEISYRFQKPERGDVVVFRPPDNQSIFYIKRVIALPGETIMIKDQKISIINSENPEGLLLSEDSYIDGSSASQSEFSQITLKDNEYFVLGDNRGNSRDSRVLGPINIDFIKGKVMLRVFPFNKLSLAQRPEYGLLSNTTNN